MFKATINFCTLLVVGAIPCLCWADFLVPEFRGAPLSTYQQWQIFTTTSGPNFPDFADQNPNGTATLIETTGGAFVTSGGNIYSFAVATHFVVVIPDFDLGPQASSRFVVQIRTLGTTVDLSSVSMNGIIAESAELLYEEPLGGFGGVLRDWKFEWVGLSGNLPMNVLEFSAEGSSMSLDRLAVDTLASENTAPIFVAGHILHVGFSGSSSDPWKGLDQRTNLILRNAEPTQVQIDNLTNGDRGINGILFDIAGLTELHQIDFQFQWSPQGVFDYSAHPVSQWGTAPTPVAMELLLGAGHQSSNRVRIQWSDYSIVNRYLKISIRAAGNLLAELYVGHLLGETTGTNGDTFSVSFADITPIRAAVGQTVTASSLLDINKDGLVTFADISAVRASGGIQLTRLTIPAN
jgi:hypothetical protein